MKNMVLISWVLKAPPIWNQDVNTCEAFTKFHTRSLSCVYILHKVWKKELKKKKKNKSTFTNYVIPLANRGWNSEKK